MGRLALLLTPLSSQYSQVQENDFAEGALEKPKTRGRKTTNLKTQKTYNGKTADGTH